MLKYCQSLSQTDDMMMTNVMLMYEDGAELIYSLELRAVYDNYHIYVIQKSF